MRLGTLVAMATKVLWDLMRIIVVQKFFSQLYAYLLMRFNVRLSRACPNKM